MSAIVARRRAEQLAIEMELKRPHVDVARVARHLGARVTEMPLDDASGLLITQPGAVPCIVVNKSHHPHRQRFTIAHELGHLVLKHHFDGAENVHVGAITVFSEADLLNRRGARG